MNSSTHTAAYTILKNKNLMSLLVFLIRWHLYKFKDKQSILNALRIAGNAEEVNDSTVRLMLLLLSHYLEHSVINKLKDRDVKYYVIADVKEGILFVRFLNGLIPEEHLIGSFKTSFNTCPLAYLIELGIPVKILIGVSMSSFCDSSYCKCH